MNDMTTEGTPSVCNDALNITSITDEVKVVIVVHCDKKAGHQGRHGRDGKISWNSSPA
jgi:hypothetical protein